jgi:hypothetical protein
MDDNLCYDYMLMSFLNKEMCESCSLYILRHFIRSEQGVNFDHMLYENKPNEHVAKLYYSFLIIFFLLS